MNSNSNTNNFNSNTNNLNSNTINLNSNTKKPVASKPVSTKTPVSFSKAKVSVNKLVGTIQNAANLQTPLQSNMMISSKPVLPTKQTAPMKSKKAMPSSVKQVWDDDEPITIQDFSKTTTNTPLSETEIKQAIKLSIQLKRKIVQSSSFNEQTFPMLVSLKADNLKSESKAPLDLVCVIDHSGSMQGQKIELVRNTFNYLLEYLGDNDRLSIVIFDDKAERLLPLMRTTEANKKVILDQIRTIRDQGGTDINLGMRTAFRVLNERKYKNAVSSIFLLSDGLDGGAQGKVKQSLSSMNVKDDVTINTFGFGNDHDPQLMNDIAALRDGNFYFIKQLDTVDEAFVDCLGGLQCALGQNVYIKIKPEQSEQLSGVKIVKAYGDPAMWAKEGDIYITKLATLISGVQKDFVLELSIPANSKELQDHQKSIRVASAEASLTSLDGKSISTQASLNITLLNEDEEVKDEEEDNREVMKNFFRVKGAVVIDESRKLADQAKYEDAKKMISNFKEELENSFLKNEEFIKNLIEDLEQAIKNVDPVVYHGFGKHEMIENARAQMYQKSNLKSKNSYQNKEQEVMMFAVKSKKAAKF